MNAMYISKLHYMKMGIKQDQASPFFDKLVFNKVSEGLQAKNTLCLFLYIRLSVLSNIHYVFPFFLAYRSKKD